MAKKVIRLTEQDLVGILKNILGGKVPNLKDKDFFTNFMPNLDDLSSLVDGESDKNSVDIKNISPKGQELLKNPIFKQKVKEMSSEIGIDENSIINLMKHESGLNSSIVNSSGCVGLIQFCPDNSGGSTKTINGKTYNLNELKDDLELQLDAIKDFWSKGKRDGKIKDAEDLYIYNFFPVAAGKSDDFVLQTKGLSAEKIARANPIYNRTLGRPINTPLTVGDLRDYYQMKGMV
jgi:hypothetical protein